MIHEITQFIDYLEDKSPEVFSENLKLKEGLYIFLEKEGDELVIKEENVLKVDGKTEQNQLYNEFISLVANTEMLNAMKSFNSGPKIYIAIGSPFGIAISGLGLEKGIEKRLDAADAYFKAATKYVDKKNERHIEWMNEFKYFVNTEMFNYVENTEEYKSLKKGDMFYFFLKEPELKDYQEIQSLFLSEKLFNKDKFNIKTEDGEIFGISDNLSGFNDSKEFLKHKTAPLDLNYRVNGIDAMKLYKFFRLQQKNKILPNPMPLFVDEKELTEKAVKFYKNDKKAGHKEIVEHLLENREKDLQNYYLIFFQNGQKGSRIVDLEFVPVFKHKFVKEMKIETIFNTANNKIVFNKIETVFNFETLLNDKLFLQYPKNSTLGYGILRTNYFSGKIEPYKGYTISDITINLIFKYRKAFYDYVYKSKRQVITFSVFDDIMKSLIIDDLRHDKYEKKINSHTKEIAIKEKLNIWFSLYNYFKTSNQKTINMANNIEKHRELVIEVAENKRNIVDDDEFAFIAGQVIYYLLSKSKSSDKSYSRLEPFLQKSNYKEFRKALSLTFNMYKHENFSKRFRNPFANVMDHVPETNFKELIPTFIAGFFSNNVLFSQDDTKEKEQESS